MDNEAHRGFSTGLQDGNELKMMFLKGGQRSDFHSRLQLCL